MGQFKDISIRDVMDEINVSYFLPDIQREYVWLDRARERKIEQLFDSILRGYPIGSFLFWELRTSQVETDRTAPDSDKLNFQLYKFIEDYDVRKRHNEKIDVSKINSNNLHIVLDGQQRLTSLYIGLKGSRTLKLPYYSWDSQFAFPQKHLYLNLRFRPTEEDAEQCYQFEFLDRNNVPAPDENNYWFRVGDVLKISSVMRYSREHDLDDDAADTLDRLAHAICQERLISYYEETEPNLDKVLRIFIRVNSGGTKLSYSDLLMSILTANFSSDIRETMNNLVDKIYNLHFGCFSRDHVLKTSLMLTGANHVFKLSNFSKTNISRIEQQWTAIVEVINDAIKIVTDFGYAGCLSSGYILSVIALYLYRNGLKYTDMMHRPKDKDAMWKFVRVAQILAYFSASLDTKLTGVIEEMNSSADFSEFVDRMAANRQMRLSADSIDDLLNVQYGTPTALPVLQMLYPGFDYKNSTFHIDHIYPKSKFEEWNTRLDPAFLGDRDMLFNLQLLSGVENQSKSDLDPAEWLQDHFATDQDRRDYKLRNYIDPDHSLEWEDFGTFKEYRLKQIRKALAGVLGASVKD